MRMKPPPGSSDMAATASWLALLDTVRPPASQQLESPTSTSDERMYELVQLEHAVSQRVLHGLPEVQRYAHETGMRRATFFLQMEKMCDWSVTENGVRLHGTLHRLITVASTLLSLVNRLHIWLSMRDRSDHDSLAAEMGCALSLLQGLCLTNATSKQLCSRRSALQLLLAIVSNEYVHGADENSSLRHLASHAIDTLMCTLVDALPATRRVFEHAHGLSIIRRTMNAHTPSGSVRTSEPSTDVTGSKCFEFLLFYLQTKAFEEQAAQHHSGTTAQSLFKPPETPKPKRGHARSKSAITTTASPFYPPMSTPQMRGRVLSYGSPTKPVSHSRTPMPLDINPFLHAQERAAPRVRELEPEDALQTPRARQSSISEREASPGYPGRRPPLRSRDTPEARAPPAPRPPSFDGPRW